MSRSTSIVLTARRLVKQFDGDERQFELQVPHLEVRVGSVNIIIGRSGCGKSTLLDMLGLISRPDSMKQFCIAAQGRNFQVGSAISAPEAEWLRRHALGYILQTGGLLPFLTVRENVMLACRLSGQGDAERAAELSVRLGIDSLASLYPAQLSTGQRQRVAIARALVHRPSLILADEPTGALDPESARTVKDMLLENARREGAAVIIVTHDAELFRRDADRVYGFRLKVQGKRVISMLQQEINA